METKKYAERRHKEGWFARYANEYLLGIDIHCGDDPINGSYRRYHHGHDGDATHVAEIRNGEYRVVYAGHVLEKLADPLTAIRNWNRILTAGGHLIVVVAHRDLYEKRKRLPSIFNPEHKSFWLPRTGEPPDTRGLWETMMEAVPTFNPVSLRILDNGFYDRGADVHSEGEYAIEMIVRTESS